MIKRILALGLAFTVSSAFSAEQTEKNSSRQAIKAVSELIGPSASTHTPTGTKEEQQKGFWMEKMTWNWKFQDKAAWFVVDFEKGKYYTSGELRYDHDNDN